MFDDDFGCALTLVGAGLILFTLWKVGGCCVDVYHEQAAEIKAKKDLRVQAEERAKREAERKARELAQKKEVARQAASREEKLRSFTLKEAPILWTTYQNLQAEIENQNEKIDELRGALESFGRDPDADADFKRICSMRDEMIGSLRTMRTKIEDAYLAARKYEATPSRKDYAELRRKLLEDGIQEAESAAKKFTEMRNVK